MKEKVKKPNQAIIIIGFVLIWVGVIMGSVNLIASSGKKHDEEIKKNNEINMLELSIEKKFLEHSNSGNLSVNLSENGDGYDADISMWFTYSETDNPFSHKESCGMAGTEFIIVMKEYLPETDKKIKKYHFEFLGNYFKPAYTAVFNNDAAAGEEISLAIKDGDILLESKTYAQYWEDARNSGVPFRSLSYILEYDSDGVKPKPRTEADNVRNEQSTLMQYEHDYYSQYFLLSDFKLTKLTSYSLLNLNFLNTSDYEYENVSVYCNFFDIYGRVIDQSLDYVKSIKPGQTYIMEISEWAVEQPVSFKITQINFYCYETNPSNRIKIIFD